jgi:hypothetical protein
MSLAVITINNLSPALEKKHQEVRIVAQYVEQALQAMGGAGGLATSGNIKVGDTTVGTWTYTPQASS